MDSYQRSDVLWLDDGNIVLEAEGTIFRVYRGILSNSSPVFAAMFAIPQPSAVDEEYDSCTVVHMPDNAHHLQHLLRALYDPSFAPHPPDKVQFPVVDGILRLATKYDIPFLRRRCIHQLGLSYPLSHKEFSQRMEHEVLVDKCPFGAVNLARATNVPSILPGALYCAAAKSLEEILGGRQVGDGSLSQLNPDDVNLCVLGHEQLASARQRETFTFLLSAESIAMDCLTPGLCATFREQRLREISAEGIPKIAKCSQFLVTSAARKTLCSHCRERWRLQEKNAWERIWATFPALFGLPSYEELRTTLTA